MGPHESLRRVYYSAFSCVIGHRVLCAFYGGGVCVCAMSKRFANDIQW